MSDFAKAITYKLAVDVPVLLLLSWMWFGHPGHNLWFVGASTTVGTLLLYFFEKYWAIQDRWHHALPLAIAWLLMMATLLAYVWTQN